MKEAGLSAEDAGRFSVTPAALSELLLAVESGEISGSAGKLVLEEMVASGRPAADIIRAKNLRRVSDDESLLPAIEAVIRDNEKQVALYRSGKSATFGWLVGQAMKATQGRADPEALSRLLRKLLDS
jgi:aspartyl-tRNA(Asn)/glutamyl-tRNA(Gln) amidotransferase subunit B